ncbi:Gfo/Idh/MocA family oxidoreductase [Runella sp. MFBS21]|uniref:Gfo/Idh/MocA family oxidoreductase n=1 Tax=Runella sp. MFBS21 TaxID=3034018 RepID=UPI0023F96B92|nr:Gfo/Idh/MocA family oxidoreductase [Runella sp. MFBS21]MDF7819330.1 Gfo/Idh/MocA family oxidoreductase [Runella sp. MFBS21]
MIKIGIIGMSLGNAHPYSWSAIINGQFDGEEISRVGYPAVAAYLNANKDTLGIPGAYVTHVWTQDTAISESIAQTTNIPHIVTELVDMIGEVDAVLLARDDPERHREMAAPFIEAGIPIFVDKPLAYSTEDLEWFASQWHQGKFIMSCSSMRYANEGRILKQELATLGKLELITAVGKKDWKKYGIHLLEGIFSIIDFPPVASVRHIGELEKEIVHIELESGLQITLHLFQDIAGTFQFSFFGQSGWRLVDIKNSYSMFRDNLIEFIRAVAEGKPRIEFSETELLMRIIIAANQSRLEGGRTLKI